MRRRYAASVLTVLAFIAAVAVLAAADDALFVNIACLDHAADRIVGQFWRYMPWGTDQGGGWSVRTENLYQNDMETTSVKSTQQWGTDPYTFYFGGNFQFYRAGSMWKYLALFNSVTEQFLPSHGAILPNGPVNSLKRIGDELVIAGQFTGYGLGETPNCSVVYQVNAAGDTPTCLQNNLSVDMTQLGAVALGGTASNDIWIGGQFNVDGKPANLAHYDGTSWKAVALPTNGAVTVVREDGFGNIYLATTSASTASLYFGAKNQDGTTTFTFLADARSQHGNAAIHALHMRYRGDAVNETLFIAGNFDGFSSGAAAQSVAVAKTASIRAAGHTATINQLGPGVLGNVLSLHESHKTHRIYFGGENLALTSQPSVPVATLEYDDGASAFIARSPAGFDGSCITHSVIISDRTAPTNGGSNKGLIIGLSVGGAVLLILVVGGLVWWFVIRKKTAYRAIN